jgi:hypothetical protein
MDDDDKFWKIPEGRSWGEAGPILRSLGTKPANPVKQRRRRTATQSPSKPWTPQQRAEQYQRTADFYRRIGQNFEADYWDKQAAKARAVMQGQANG